MRARIGRPLTGRGVLAMMLGAFGVIIAVNATLAVQATGSFPGLVVKNSYVASQHFDARRRAIEGLDWRTSAAWREGALALSVTDTKGRTVEGLNVTVSLGRPAAGLTDRTVRLRAEGGAYMARPHLAPGRWRALFRIDDGEAAVELEALIRVPQGAS